MTRQTDTPPFFIVGAGRSGTTLVRTLLAAHSRITVPPETHFLKWIDEYGAKQLEAPKDFDDFWAKLIQRIHFRDLGIDPDRVMALTEETGGRTFKGVFGAMLAAYAEDEGKPRRGEKTPGHYFYQDRIFRWWPDARIIVVRRDPRSTISSHLEAPWVSQQLGKPNPGTPLVQRYRLYHVAHHAKLWRDAYGKHLAQTDDPRFHTLSYEDLVADPAARIAEVATFLGERFEPEMIDRRDTLRGAAADSRKPEWQSWVREHNEKSKSKISTDGLTKWRSKLSPREVAVIEAICGRTMERFDYTPDRSAARRIYPALLGFATLRASGVERRARGGVNRLRRSFTPDRSRA
ncbi:sulfotransferase [Loktanella sp. SALINAS62]|uniref:sulfotransferase family protein n=1 Tax=Loktanella sp. SALINAS62 TaxID=2706124 RepID=UPI001B8BFDD1|nr:sulfotransferase [Loktanella sp. SALINAS62]MBS1302167.1 sulfotransferase [Loktanella sp. SALINAS62]